MFVQELAERFLRRVSDALYHQVKRVLGGTNRPHAMVDSTGSMDHPRRSQDDLSPHSELLGDSPETALYDLKALTPPIDEVLHGYTNVLVNNLTMALGRVIIPEDTHRANDLQTDCISGHDDNALLVVFV